MPKEFLKNYNILLLLGIGLLFRFTLFFYFFNEVSLFPDSQDYIILYDFLKNFSLFGYNGWRTPGYSLLFFLTNGNLFAIVMIQLILGTIASIFWYKTLLNLKFNTITSFYIALFLQTLINVITYEISILTESFILFFLSIIIYLLSADYFQNKSIKKELILGLLLGYLAFIKPFFTFLPFLIYGLYVLNDFKIKRIINRKLIIFIFPLLAYFGWSYVNKIHTGYYVSTTFFGLNIAQNCVRFAEKGPEEFKWISEPYVTYREKSIEEHKTLAYSIWYAYHEGAFDKYNMSFPDLSNELGKYGKATIKNNPLDYLKQVVFYSYVDFWKPSLLWNTSKIKRTKWLLIGLWNVQFAVLLVFRAAFSLIILCYLYRFIRKLKTDTVTLFVFIVFSASVLQAIVTYGSNSRYSFPFEFIMVIIVFHFLKEHNVKFNSLFGKKAS